MVEHFADRLIDAIDRKGSPICVGIDPILESLPDSVFKGSSRDPYDLDGSVDAISDFTMKVLEIVAPHVPCVKFQSAYFEKYLWEGVQAYFELIQEARNLGLLVIGDVKRGDIGSTSEAYASAHLADTRFAEMEQSVTPDAITVNPMLGMDTLQPFVEAASEYRKGMFVLVRTSNPGSGVTQDVKLADGRTWSEMLADELRPIAESTCGARGHSLLGAVVGATQPATMSSLRGRLPKSIFLLPGYGTQGATADMTRAAFNPDGHGALVSASRSILYAPRTTPSMAWEDAVRDAVQKMRTDLAGVTR